MSAVLVPLSGPDCACCFVAGLVCASCPCPACVIPAPLLPAVLAALVVLWCCSCSPAAPLFVACPPPVPAALLFDCAACSPPLMCALLVPLFGLCALCFCVLWDVGSPCVCCANLPLLPCSVLLPLCLLPPPCCLLVGPIAARGCAACACPLCYASLLVCGHFSRPPDLPAVCFCLL